MENRPWLQLVTSCAVAVLATALALAVVFVSATATLSFAVGQSAQQPDNQPAVAPARTFSGVITDSHCIAKHQMSDKNPAECTRICVRDGAKYTLVDGDRVFALTGDVVLLSQFAGRRATIAGTREGNVIQVNSVSN
jgi:hypothetical protein